MLNVHVKSVIFNGFAHEILPVDAVWSWSSCISKKFKDIFEENLSRILTVKALFLTHHFVAFEEQMVTDGRQSNIMKESSESEEEC